jgi:hypothetical protein
MKSDFRIWLEDYWWAILLVIVFLGAIVGIYYGLFSAVVYIAHMPDLQKPIDQITVSQAFWLGAALVALNSILQPSAKK